MPIIAVHHILVMGTANVIVATVRNVAPLGDANILEVWDVPVAGSVGTHVLVVRVYTNAVTGKNVFLTLLLIQIVAGRIVFALNILALCASEKIFKVIFSRNSVNQLRACAAIFLLLLVACSSAVATESSRQIEDQEVSVTRDDPGLPQGCSPNEVAHLLLNFLEAYNVGNQDELAELFAFGRESWFSDSLTEAKNFTAYNEAEMLEYLADRYQHEDSLQLRQVDVAGPSWHGGADIAFRLMRKADDLKPDTRERYVEGKGAIYCQTQQIMVWSMGTVSPDISEADLVQLCPDPPDGTPENAAVACARPVPEEEG